VTVTMSRRRRLRVLRRRTKFSGKEEDAIPQLCWTREEEAAAATEEEDRKRKRR